MKLINDEYSHPAVAPDPTKPVKTNDFSKDVLPIGTKVRIQLDNPIDYVEERKLHGKFRTGDIRYTKKIGEITRFYLRPDQPPMYEVDNNSKVAYTKYQLQVVKEDEVKPSTKKQKKHYAQEILKKETIKGKVYFTVRWEDNDRTKLPYDQVKDELPDLLKEFNKKGKK